LPLSGFKFLLVFFDDLGKLGTSSRIIYGKAADPDSFVPKKYCALLLMVQKSQTTTWNV